MLSIRQLFQMPQITKKKKTGKNFTNYIMVKGLMILQSERWSVLLDKSHFEAEISSSCGCSKPT